MLLLLLVLVSVVDVVVVVVVVVHRPGIHIVWISAANINGIASLAVDTGLKQRPELILNILPGEMSTHDERNSEHLQVRSDVERILRYEALKVTVDYLNAEHGTGAANIGLHSSCLHIIRTIIQPTRAQYL